MGYRTAWTNSTITLDTINVSIAPAADEFLIAWAITDAQVTLEAYSAGWTPLASLRSTADSADLFVLYRVADGSETTVSFQTSSNSMIAGCAAFSGIDTTTPLDVAPVSIENSASSMTSDISITPATNGVVLARVQCCDTWDITDVTFTFSTTAGTTGAWTTHVDQHASYYDVALGTAEQTTAGALTNRCTTSVSGGRIGWLFALRPAAGSGSSQEQEGFRFGVDDDTESAHTWAAAQDANLTAALDTNTLLRVLVDATDDPASTAYTLRYQKNGSGGYLPVPVGASSTVAPTVEAGDCTESGNNTATTSWAVSYPAYVSGDLLVFHVASDANVTHDWPATGPNGETVNTIADSTGGTAQRASGFWFVGSATTGAGTLTVTPSASEQWTAAVLKVPAGEFNSTTPIQTNVGTANDTTADTEWATPAWTSDATAGGRVICFAAHDTVTTSATPAGWATLVARDRGACGLTLAARDAANTASESIASASFTKTSETDSSFGYVINGAVTTNEVYVSPSANIAAGGEATTARLTAPSGKTTSDFVTGRRWDDENGTDTIDITADDYTELEWCLKAVSPAEADDYYEFRVYAGSTALDTYTVTPKWTIGGGSITGTLATTESGADTAALAGDVLIDGSLAATESGGDTAALAGDVLIAGTFAATESGADVAAIQGTAQQVSTGSLAATESGADTASIAGTVLVEGALAATESGSDTAAIAGVVPVEGVLAATEAGSDTAAFDGFLTALETSGYLAATESGADVAAFAGDVLVSGALAATESGADTAAIVGAVRVTGTLAATESGQDTAHFTSQSVASGSLEATESGTDTAGFTGLVLVSGSLAATEAGSDTAAFAGTVPIAAAGVVPAGRPSRGRRRRVILGDRLYEVLERDIPALLEAELLDRAPPVTAEVIEGPKPPRKRAKKSPHPVKTVEQVRETVQQIKARIEPDDAWLAQALEAVAFRVLERLQDEEDSLMLLLAA